MLTLFYGLIVLLILGSMADGYSVRLGLGKYCRRALASQNSDVLLPISADDDLNKLHTFFEKAAKQGSGFISKLTPEQRAERAIIGMQVENDIFASADMIVELHNSMLKYPESDHNGKLDEIRALREKIKSLKEQYVVIVGSGANQ